MQEQLHSPPDAELEKAHQDFARRLDESAAELHSIHVKEHPPVVDYANAGRDLTRHVDNFQAEHGVTGDAMPLEPRRRVSLRDRLRGDGHRETLDEQDWKRKVKKFIAFTAIASFLPAIGGAVDKFGDHYSDASSTVDAAVQIHKPSLSLNDKVDGIKLSEYPIKAQKEFLGEDREEYSKELTAKETVSSLLDTLDNDGAQVVIDRAAQYRFDHASEFIAKEDLSKISEALDSAQTNDGVMRALHEFMENYGIYAGFTKTDSNYYSAFNTNTDVDATKRIAEAYMNVFAPLPKDLIRGARISTVQIANPKGWNAGDYDSNGNNMIMATSDGVVGNAIVAGGLIEDEITGGDTAFLEGKVAHELGHALKAADPSLFTELPSHVPHDIGYAEALQVPLSALDIPRIPSAYSVYKGERSYAGEELTAEQISGLLSDRTDGLASPDSWRQFNSVSNKGFINMLVGLEARFPGVSLLVIADRAQASTNLEAHVLKE